MDIRQNQSDLDKNFLKKTKKRIVFWYDEEKEFEESLPLIQVGDVTVLRLDQIECSGFEN